MNLANIPAENPPTRETVALKETPAVHLVGKDALDYFIRNTGRVNLVQKSARSQTVELILAVLGNLRDALLGQDLSPKGHRELEIRNAREFGVWFFNLDGQGGQQPPVPGDWNPIGLTFDRQMPFLELGQLRARKKQKLPHVDIFTLANAYFLEGQQRTYRQIGQELGLSADQARNCCLRCHALLHHTEETETMPLQGRTKGPSRRKRLADDALACRNCRHLRTDESGRICAFLKPQPWVTYANGHCLPAWDVADESREYGCPSVDKQLQAVTVPLREMLPRRSDLRSWECRRDNAVEAQEDRSDEEFERAQWTTLTTQIGDLGDALQEFWKREAGERSLSSQVGEPLDESLE